MALLLTMIFSSVAIGLFADRFGARQYWLIGLLATSMTVLYLVFPKLM
jgi:MFS family permease